VEQMLQLTAILLLAQQQAAVGDAESLPSVAGQSTGAVDDSGRGEQQHVDAELLGGVLDAVEESAVEVVTSPRERRLVGEHSQDLVAAAGEPLRQRVGGVARDANRLENAVARLIG